ncbi:MAG TPA: fused MFS/spermidine synthase [Gammaproteobacteria bacterium]|nr:fused MFS/spermidine synthase [Gammaproteobacteria bacterium]
MDHGNVARPQRVPPVSLVFFLSGASALIFETSWFHVMGIVLGSSVWSAAAVLTAFMSGLAIGNGVMAARGHRLGNLVRTYVVIELAIAFSGVLVIFLSPVLTPLIGGLLSRYTESHAWLNLTRFLIACCFLLAPTVAMGMTLPVLQKLLHSRHPDFVQALGRLYGWNTIGAVCGALAAEFLLIHYLGIKSAALAAAMCNFTAALILLRGSGGQDNVSAAQPDLAGFIRSTGRFLVAPCIAGLLLLALEIVWFRCLLLLNIGSSIIFAIMLATVLSGIGLGGLLVSRFRFRPASRDRLLIYLPPVAALFVTLGYYLYSFLYASHFTGGVDYPGFIAFSLLLMLPTCIVSGILFPLYGDKLYAQLPDETRAAGALTLANTLGAALGSGLATFWLLPACGLENSLFLLALGYFIAVVPMITGGRGLRVFLKQIAAPAAMLLLAVAVFPFGAMARTHFAYSADKFPKAKLVMVREGLNETSRYYEFTKFGKPIKHRLVTNAYSMSGTDFQALRYMKLFVYLPHVLHQNIHKVLQISYGVGNTAEAVVSLASVERFDVVDISADILKYSYIIHDASGRYPLRDPRTHAHIEDGRFFLQTTGEKYDLITAEPPPPKQAGVVNLYTQEYFGLIRSRLNPNGLASYWLPLHSVTEHDSLAIIKAFCLAFEDCSLWLGGGLDFILLGSNGGIRPQTAESFARPWSGPLAPELAAIGVETPAQLGPLFVADADMLDRLSMQAAPVTDNFPHRISPDSKHGLNNFSKFYESLLDIRRRRQAFAASPYVRQIFPAPVRVEAMRDFHYENLLAGRITEGRYVHLDSYFWEELTNVLTKTHLKVLPLLMLDSSPREQRIIDAVGYATDPEARLAYAKRLLCERKYKESARMLEQYIDGKGGFEKEAAQSRLYMLARALAGHPAEFPVAADDKAAVQFRNWFLIRFGSSRKL